MFLFAGAGFFAFKLSSMSHFTKYEEFFNSINTNSAFQVLISAINFAQRKGAYNIEECSLIDKSIKTILKESERVNADKNSK